jgi:hypothetical protein
MGAVEARDHAARWAGIKRGEKSMAAKTITATQKKIIWSIARKQLGISKDELYAAIFGMFEAERISALTYSQAELFIYELRRRAENLGPDKLTAAQYKKIMAMARNFGWTADGLRKHLQRVAKVDDARWLTPEQARFVITGLEKILKYNEKHGVNAHGV